MRAVRLVLILFLVMPGALLAGTQRITLDEALDIALRKNKEIAAARLGVEKAEAQIAEAIGNALPSLNLSAMYTRNLQLPVFFIPDFQNPSSGRLNPVTVGLDNQYSVGLSASQILFNSAVFTGIGASKIYKYAAQEQLNSTIATVLTQTKKQFFAALLARDLVGIAEASLNNGRENLSTIQVLFREGLVAEFDAIRAEVAVENIRPYVTQAEAGYRNAIHALETQLGGDFQDSLEPEGSFSATLEELPTEETAMVKALKDNYDLKALMLQTDVTKEFVSVAESDYFPTLAAFGNWQNQGQSNTFSEWTSASSTGVGLSLSMNLFNGLRTKAKVQQSQADYETVRTQLARLKDGIKLQVKSFLNLLVSARQRVQAQQRTVEQAQRGYEIAQIRYREGTGSLLEINDSDLALAQARTNKVQALHDYYSAKADMDRVLGSLDTKYFVQVQRN